MGPRGAHVGIKGKRREIACHGSLSGEFCCAHVGHGRKVIGTRSVCAFEGFVGSDVFERLVRRLIREFESLTRSQADHARYSQLLDGEVVLGLNQLLLASLELDLGTQPVDGRRGPSVHLVVCLIEQRLRRLDLRFRRFNAGFIGDGLQIGIAHGQHDEIAGVFESVLGGFQVLAGRAGSVDGLPIKERLSHRQACVKIRKGANGRWDADSRSACKPDLCEIDLRGRHIRRGRHVRKKSA